MSAAETHAQWRAALEPLGIEVGPEVLALWRDREAHGCDPLPVDALRSLAHVVGWMLVRRSSVE